MSHASTLTGWVLCPPCSPVVAGYIDSSVIEGEAAIYKWIGRDEQLGAYPSKLPELAPEKKEAFYRWGGDGCCDNFTFECWKTCIM